MRKARRRKCSRPDDRRRNQEVGRRDPRHRHQARQLGPYDQWQAGIRERSSSVTPSMERRDRASYCCTSSAAAWTAGTASSRRSRRTFACCVTTCAAQASRRCRADEYTVENGHLVDLLELLKVTGSEAAVSLRRRGGGFAGRDDLCTEISGAGRVGHADGGGARHERSGAQAGVSRSHRSWRSKRAWRW